MCQEPLPELESSTLVANVHVVRHLAAAATVAAADTFAMLSCEGGKACAGTLRLE